MVHFQDYCFQTVDLLITDKWKRRERNIKKFLMTSFEKGKKVVNFFFFIVCKV